jgi:hypothetical protein
MPHVLLAKPACLCRQSARPQAHRRGVRLDQDGGQAGEDEVPRSRSRRVGLHLRCRRLQSGSIAEAHRAKGLMAKLPALQAASSDTSNNAR